MLNIVYFYGKTAYLNITNKCPCSCTFCIRNATDSLGSADSLWLDHSPSMDEIKAAIDNAGLEKNSEIVFCGFGEPTCEIEKLILTADYLKENYNSKIRLNTNGLGNLYNGRDIIPLLKGRIDIISVSLNAPNSQEYQKTVRPRFGDISYDSMLDFTRECVAAGFEVIMSVVDIIGETAVEASRAVCESTGAKFRIRHYTEN